VRPKTSLLKDKVVEVELKSPVVKSRKLVAQSKIDSPIRTKSPKRLIQSPQIKNTIDIFDENIKKRQNNNGKDSSVSKKLETNTSLSS